jgi:hypothetical protein
MSYPHQDPKAIYGADLIKVFGPKANRKHVLSLTPQEKTAILDKVPEYVDTDDLGPRPSFYQITNKVLWVLQQSSALNGIDLTWCDSLSTGSTMHRNPEHYISTDLSYKNNSVQRGIWLRHLLKDILFEFDPNHVLMGLARKQSDGTYNFNNGQHRQVGCIIMGIREIPAEWQDSDLESVDVDQYATDNLHTLSASPFDEFRIQVRRNKIRKSENRTDLIEGDIKCETVYEIHNKYGSKFVEKGSSVINPKECTGVGNMLTYFDTYGEDIYDRAVAISCSVFSKSPLATGNCWGLMEFLKEQKNNANFADTATLDWLVQSALMHRYASGVRNGMHLDIKTAFKKFQETATTRDFDGCTEPRQIAAGIEKLCRVVHPTENWAPIRYNGKDIITTLIEFGVPPVVNA